jgi:hypothetical protein
MGFIRVFMLQKWIKKFSSFSQLLAATFLGHFNRAKPFVYGLAYLITNVVKCSLDDVLLSLFAVVSSRVYYHLFLSFVLLVDIHDALFRKELIIFAYNKKSWYFNLLCLNSRFQLEDVNSKTLLDRAREHLDHDVHNHARNVELR